MDLSHWTNVGVLVDAMLCIALVPFRTVLIILSAQNVTNIISV